MSLYILNNANSASVLNDLKTICPDPALAVDIWVSADGTSRGSGLVTYAAPTMSSVGCQMVQALVSARQIATGDPLVVAIRGESDAWADGKMLVDRGGITIGDQDLFPTLIEMVYDTNPCQGNGFWVTDSTGAHITDPTHVVLFHEMAHAIDRINGTWTKATAHAAALVRENAYRASFGLPQRFGRGGGCNPAPPVPQPVTRSDCFIATAAFGSAMAPDVQLLRSFRDNVLRKTRSGERFFDKFWEHYYRISPLIVAAMEEDEEVKELVRWSVVTPMVRHLQLLLTFPDAPIAIVEEPWKSFLTKVRDDLEVWAGEIELPRNFQDLAPAAAAEEIALVLTYVLRSEAKRLVYLADLERRGEIPLNGSEAQLRIAGQQLRSHGVSASLVDRILNSTAAQLSGQASSNMNDDEDFDFASLGAGTGIYEVTVTNLSSTVFDQIALFYSGLDAPTAVVELFENNVQNGQIAKFTLGACDLLSSYVIGFYVGNQEVASIPDSSNPIYQGQPHITPALDHQIHPTLPPCTSGWTIS